jgi:tetratricopeptide (TPR) repeat protein
LSAAEQFPGSVFVVATATERIAALSLLQQQNDEGSAVLLDLASSFPRTHLSAFARHHLADLYWRTRQPDKAAGQWQALWEYEPHRADIPNLLERLAEAWYRAGTAARLQGAFEDALVHLGFLSQMPQTQWRREHVLTATLLLDMAECHLGLEDWQDALDLARRSHEVGGQPGDIPRALYVEGCAQWGLRDYTAAAEAWQAAMSDYPATEYAEKSRERMRP